MRVGTVKPEYHAPDLTRAVMSAKVNRSFSRAIFRGEMGAASLGRLTFHQPSY